MPIQLITGLPGNGKTLRLLPKVRKLQKETSRPVYYFDIKLKDHPEVSDWIPLGDKGTFGRRKEGIEPDLSQVRRWHEIVPSGSIMVVDECWFVFPKRGPSAAVPKYVEELATHRHRGVDVFLTSQHATNQIDHFVRGLVQYHEHCVRLTAFDSKTRIHKWDQGIGDYADYHSRKESVTEIWSFPTDVYNWYHSAELHTIKRRIPWKPIGTIVGGIAAIAALGYLAVNTLFGNVDSAVGSVGPGQNPLEKGQAVLKARTSSADDFVPTLAAAPFSAPFYQEAVQVNQAPMVAGCGSHVINGDVDCRCYSQQGTVLEMSVRQCLEFVKTGSFRFDNNKSYYPEIEPYVPPLAEPQKDQTFIEQKKGPEGPSSASNNFVSTVVPPAPGI